MSHNRLFPSAILIIAAVVLVAVALYWPTVGLPLLYDDLLHIRITKGLNLATVWLPTESFGFYRPLTFLPLLIIDRLFGYYPAELLHGINVVQHALNAGLLALLSWRLWHRRHWVLAAGLLFVLFTFSYQAIAVYGHNVHSATASLLLLGLHTYLYAKKGDDRALLWWVLTSILFLLALLSHESAILFGAFAALVQWNADGALPRAGKKNWWQILSGQPWLIFLLLGIGYLVAYQFLPITRAPQADFDGTAAWFKLLYLLQAASYPITWLNQLAPTETPAIIILLGLILVLSLTAWSSRAPANRLPLLLGWGWWGLASLLIAIPLSATYLLHGPRLLYLGSIGLALLWPVLLEPVYNLPRIGKLVWLAGLAFILIASWLFVRDRLSAYAQLTSPLNVVESVMAERPAKEGIVMVNLPQWLDKPRSSFPVGVEFVSMLGDYLFVEELISENLAVDRPVQSIKVPDLLSSPGYNYSVHEQSASRRIDGSLNSDGRHIFITRYSEAGLNTHYAGYITQQPTSAAPIATFGSYELLSASANSCDGVILLTSKWKYDTSANSLPPGNQTTSVFAHLLNGDGQLIAQTDGPLLGLRPDLLLVQDDSQMIDVREIHERSESPEVVLLGMYDFANGDRYRGVDQDGTSLPDDALRLSVNECS